MKHRMGQHKRTMVLFCALAVTAFTMLTGVAFASAPGDTSAAVTGGSLSISSPLTGGTFAGTLIGAARTLNASDFSGFSIECARGTGVAWEVTMQASVFDDATGAGKDLAANSLTMPALAVAKADAGSSAVPGTLHPAATIDTGASGVVMAACNANGQGMGTYDFTSAGSLPWQLAVTAGEYAGTYHSTVTTTLSTLAPSPAKALIAFTTPTSTATTIDQGAHTIAVSVPSGTPVSALVASFTTTGAAVKVGAATQTSGTTANDFSSPVTYTVTAADGTTQTYTVTVTVTVAASPVAVGDAYQGGRVAYILQPGDPGYSATVQHGLIAATVDQATDSTGIAWTTGGNTQTTFNGSTSTALGTGQANTNAMMAQPGYTGGAAKVCADYTNTDTGHGVYSDWYLPSKDELNKLDLNQAVLGSGHSIWYYSSSESDASHAWYGLFLNHNQYSGDAKSYLHAVRAVRSF